MAGEKKRLLLPASNSVSQIFLMSSASVSSAEAPISPRSSSMVLSLAACCEQNHNWHLTRCNTSINGIKKSPNHLSDRSTLFQRWSGYFTPLFVKKQTAKLNFNFSLRVDISILTAILEFLTFTRRLPVTNRSQPAGGHQFYKQEGRRSRRYR